MKTIWLVFRHPRVPLDAGWDSNKLYSPVPCLTLQDARDYLAAENITVDEEAFWNEHQLWMRVHQVALGQRFDLNILIVESRVWEKEKV